MCRPAPLCGKLVLGLQFFSYFALHCSQPQSTSTYCKPSPPRVGSVQGDEQLPGLWRLLKERPARTALSATAHHGGARMEHQGTPFRTEGVLVDRVTKGELVNRPGHTRAPTGRSGAHGAHGEDGHKPTPLQTLRTPTPPGRSAKAQVQSEATRCLALGPTPRGRGLEGRCSAEIRRTRSRLSLRWDTKEENGKKQTEKPRMDSAWR